MCTQVFSQIVELLQVVAWPLIVLIVFWGLKKPLQNLLSRLSKLTVAGVQAEATPPVQSLSSELSKGITDSISTEPAKIDRNLSTDPLNIPSGLKIIRNSLATLRPETISLVSSFAENEIHLTENMDEKGWMD
jgi:hypothetical protein